MRPNRSATRMWRGAVIGFFVGALVLATAIGLFTWLPRSGLARIGAGILAFGFSPPYVLAGVLGVQSGWAGHAAFVPAGIFANGALCAAIGALVAWQRRAGREYPWLLVPIAWVLWLAVLVMFGWLVLPNRAL